MKINLKHVELQRHNWSAKLPWGTVVFAIDVLVSIRAGSIRRWVTSWGDELCQWRTPQTSFRYHLLIDGFIYFKWNSEVVMWMEVLFNAMTCFENYKSIIKKITIMKLPVTNAMLINSLHPMVFSFESDQFGTRELLMVTTGSDRLMIISCPMLPESSQPVFGCWAIRSIRDAKCFVSQSEETIVKSCQIPLNGGVYGGSSPTIEVRPVV